MNDHETVWSAIESAAGNPKIATAVAAGTGAMGGAYKLGLVQDYLSTATLAVGLMTGCVVLAVQVVKLLRTWRAYQNDEPDEA